MKKFGDRVSEELAKRDWKPADLARASNMDSAVISNLLNSRRHPSVESCKLIARALNIPIIEIFRWADFLPPDPDVDPITETVMHLTLELPAEDKKDILEYVRLRHRMANNRPYTKGAGAKANSKRTITS